MAFMESPLVEVGISGWGLFINKNTARVILLTATSRNFIRLVATGQQSGRNRHFLSSCRLFEGTQPGYLTEKRHKWEEKSLFDPQMTPSQQVFFKNSQKGIIEPLQILNCKIKKKPKDSSILLY
jgi:hypothetical protein